MTTESMKLIRAFLKLNDSDKKEVADYISNYQGLGYFEKGQRSESFLNQAKVLGPISSNGCPYCGK